MNAVFTNEQYMINVSAQSQALSPAAKMREMVFGVHAVGAGTPSLRSPRELHNHPVQECGEFLRRFSVFAVQPLADESVSPLIKEQAELLSLTRGKGCWDRLFDLHPYRR